MTKYVGLSLIIGFSIMLLLDQGFLIIKEWEVKKAKKDEEHDHSHIHESHQS